jgi:NAD(P)-dependent dehydrogenase (short-subunit alcohol dehydrogenase family)
MTSPSQGIAWVTGASSGIGRATALRLARNGWRVACTARRADVLEALAAEGDGRLLPYPADVTDADSVRAVVGRIQAEQGPIALAILSAGGYEADSAEGLDLAAFRRTTELNLLGTAACIAALLPDWRARRQGHLAVISSVAGYVGLPDAVSYSATKAALIAMCESLRFDFRRLGLVIQLVSPGFVKTPLTDRNRFPMPFLISAEDAADRIVAGLARGGFEIAFPRRMAWSLKLLRALPYALYFPLVSRFTGK